MGVDLTAVDAANTALQADTRAAKTTKAYAAAATAALHAMNTPAPTPPPPASTYPRQGISVPLDNFQAHRATFLPELKALSGGKPMFMRTDWWHGDNRWNGLVAEAATYGVTMLPLYGFAWGAADAPSLATFTEQADEAAMLTGWLNLLNEPNLNGWSPQDAALYTSSAYTAAHAANPNVRVIGPDVAFNDTHSAGSAVTWLNGFAAAGGKIDVLAANLYDAPPNGLWPLVPQLKAAYPTLPVFCLEGGYWNSANTAYTAAVINASMTARDAGYVDSYLVYSLYDDASPGGFGLIDSSGAERPAFVAFKGKAI